MFALLCFCARGESRHTLQNHVNVCLALFLRTGLQAAAAMNRQDPQAHVVVPLKGQDAFALGVLCFEVAAGEHPLGDYPAADSCSADAFAELDVRKPLEALEYVWWMHSFSSVFLHAPPRPQHIPVCMWEY